LSDLTARTLTAAAEIGQLVDVLADGEGVGRPPKLRTNFLA
jgi:hypothetical protein